MTYYVSYRKNGKDVDSQHETFASALKVYRAHQVQWPLVAIYDPDRMDYGTDTGFYDGLTDEERAQLRAALGAVGTEDDAVEDGEYEPRSLRISAKLQKLLPAYTVPTLPTDAEYEARMDALLTAKAPEVVKVQAPRPASTERTGLLGTYEPGNSVEFAGVRCVIDRDIETNEYSLGWRSTVFLVHEGALADMAKRPGAFDAGSGRDARMRQAILDGCSAVMERERTDAVHELVEAAHALVTVGVVCVNDSDVPRVHRLRDALAKFKVSK